MSPPELESVSRRVRDLPVSRIRALLNAPRSAQTLDLGGGHPEPAWFPAQALAAAADRLLSEKSASVLQYAPTEGLGDLRARIADRLERRGFAVLPEQVLITQGSQQALHAAATLLASPGDPVTLEEPVYLGAVQSFCLAEAVLSGLRVTDDGWDFDALAAQRPKALYCMSHHQNPTGRCTTLTERERMARFAAQREFYVLEDDAYSELYFDHDLARPLVADCPKWGLLLGSFSKTICPGLRLGYIVSPQHLVEPLVRVLQTTTLQPGTFTQHLVNALLEDFDYEAYLTRLRTLYEQRAQALSLLCHELRLSHRAPRGGFFLWVKLPAEGCASRLCTELAQRELLAVPEAAFQFPGGGKRDDHLRLAFCRFTGEERQAARFREAFAALSVL